MAISITPAYIAVVGDDHTIVLPDNVPVGSRVTITIIPPEQNAQDEEARAVRFAATHAALQAALRAPSLSSTLSEAEINHLIKVARKAASSQ